MKKSLLFMALTMLYFTSFAQIRLSEFYVRPSAGNNEYFELYNNSAASENLNCYSLVSFFNTGGEIGFYVLDLPDVNVPAGGTFVASSATVFNYDGTPSPAVANFNWNSPGSTARLQKYVITEDAGGNLTFVLDTDPLPADFNDLFVSSSFSETGGDPTIYGVGLFKNGVLVDDFINVNTGDINEISAEDITLPNLVISAFNNCTGFTINFNDITDTIVDHLLDLGPADVDRGYHFVFCGGTWVRGTTPEENTPGVANPPIGEDVLEGLFNATTATSECGTTPRTVTVNVGNPPNSALPPVVLGTSATVNLYVDLGTPGVLDAADIFVGSAPIASLPGTVTIQDAAARTGTINYLVQVVFNSICQSIFTAPAGCIVTPVTFKAFKANRNKANVALDWETSAEQDNKGFNIQRKQNGEWETIAFVPTKADNGNSNADLAYSYTDVNNYSGVSQYRLEQVDVDGDIEYSPVRSVNGNAHGAKLVIYPNPSYAGKVNVAFSEANVRDLWLNDISGRLVKEWKGYRNMTLLIENLQSGVYTLRVVDVNSGALTTEKIVISK